ncbi:hypothetical protein RRG08_031706 [Elysia crispata]|uniref:Uncharacterized protein n=1 Tax=Elysia crispata TaxID=231223 RepID=A0AAE1DF40_9GAST|nr:hypothetical protein RRG08_031706 [Elysia crispata]
MSERLTERESQPGDRDLRLARAEIVLSTSTLIWALSKPVTSVTSVRCVIEEKETVYVIRPHIFALSLPPFSHFLLPYLSPTLSTPFSTSHHGRSRQGVLPHDIPFAAMSSLRLRGTKESAHSITGYLGTELSTRRFCHAE